MARCKATIYCSTVTYAGKFEDNDIYDIIERGKAFGNAEFIEASFYKSRKDAESRVCEEVRDNRDGTCDVYWYELDDEELTDEERDYQAELELADRWFDEYRLGED